jgi:hypothetical protein
VGWKVIISGGLVVASLLGVAGFYTWRQVVLLRRLGQRPDLGSEEHSFLRRQAWRRLINSGLMLILAGLFAFALVYLEGPVQQVADEREAMPAENTPPLTPQQAHLVNLWLGLYIAILLVLLAVLFFAAVDLWSTRRYARKAYRKLQDDRRAMIERQVIRLRQERNGH